MIDQERRAHSTRRWRDLSSKEVATRAASPVRFHRIEHNHDHHYVHRIEQSFDNHYVHRIEQSLDHHHVHHIDHHAADELMVNDAVDQNDKKTFSPMDTINADHNIDPGNQGDFVKEWTIANILYKFSDHDFSQGSTTNDGAKQLKNLTDFLGNCSNFINVGFSAITPTPYCKFRNYPTTNFAPMPDCEL